MKTFVCLLIFCLNISYTYSQIVSKDLSAGDYKISLVWNDSVFYSGKMNVLDSKSNSIVFTAESFYSGYNWDSLADLNNDGINEYILELETGDTRSDYNMYVIFDFTKSSQPLFKIHNAELVTKVDKSPAIVSNVRIGPPAMEAKYSYVVFYENGKLIPVTDPKESKVLKELVPYEEDYSGLISDYAKKSDVCGSNSEVKNYYAAYITQQKVVNNEDAGWKFFDKNYTCSDKENMKEVIKKIVDDNYSKVTDPGSFNFNQ